MERVAGRAPVAMMRRSKGSAVPSSKSKIGKLSMPHLVQHTDLQIALGPVDCGTADAAGQHIREERREYCAEASAVTSVMEQSGACSRAASQAAIPAAEEPTTTTCPANSLRGGRAGGGSVASASVGQAATQAGVSRSRHTSQRTTWSVAGSGRMPCGHTIMHMKHPTQRLSSSAIQPVIGSLRRAPLLQLKAHNGSAHCSHRRASMPSFPRRW